MTIMFSVGCVFCTVGQYILDINWQLSMVSWIIISTDTGSPTLLPCAHPFSRFGAERQVIPRRAVNRVSKGTR